MRTTITGLYMCVAIQINANVHYCLVTVSIGRFSTPARVPTYISMTITAFLYIGT